MFICKSCTYVSKEPKLFLSHLKNSHRDKKAFQCGANACNRIFNSLNTLRSHVYKKHKEDSDDEKPPKKIKKIVDVRVAEDEIINDDVGSNTRDDNESIPEGTLQLRETIPQNSEQISMINPRVAPLKNTKNNVDDALALAANLYSYVDISRKRTNEIIILNSDYFHTVFEKIKESVVNAVNSETEKSAICQIFEKNSDPLKNFKTEQKSFTQFKNHGTYIPPQSYLLGNRQEFKLKNGRQILNLVPVTAQFIPIRHVLKKFLELPNVFDETMIYLEHLKKNSTIMCNFIQGNLWKRISVNEEDKIILPLFLYYDDYENNNPLGSHRGISKCGAVYISVPCLPPRFQGKLENIFLFVLFNTLDRKYFKNEIIFSKIKDELEFLGTVGITINHLSGPKTIYFKLSLVIGDNLGLQYMLGFTESFNQRKFCRFCYIDRKKISSVLSESDCILRTEMSYEADVARKDPKATGITGRSLLFGINNYHPITHPVVDYVHDLLEGVCRYDLALILYHFIVVLKLFKLDDLNTRIKGFHYGPEKNKPPEILIHQLNEKLISMSASEMLTLVRHLSLIIGHLIPKGDEVWDMFLSLRDIIDICTSHQLDANTCCTLSVIITDYLRSLNKLFPNSMKPKHHFLVHYPRVLLLCSSLSRISTIRYEAKHRDGKRTSSVAISRVNVCKTIAIKHQLQLNRRFIGNQVPEILIYATNSVKKISILDINTDINIQQYLLPFKESSSKLLLTVKKLSWDGLSISEKCIIMTPSEEGPLFFEVNRIIIHGNNNFVLLVKFLGDVFYDLHTQAYEVKSHNYCWKVLTQSDLYGCSVTYVLRTSGGFRYIVKNWW